MKNYIYIYIYNKLIYKIVKLLFLIYMLLSRVAPKLKNGHIHEPTLCSLLTLVSIHIWYMSTLSKIHGDDTWKVL